MKKDPDCYVCRKPATALCDYTLGPRAIPASTFDKAFSIATCDRPMCDEHRVRVGHICNRSKKSQSDTIDYCQEHYLETSRR